MVDRIKEAPRDQRMRKADGRSVRLLATVDGAQLVALGNSALDISRGAVSGYSTVNKFGRNTSVGTTEIVIWHAGVAYTGFLTSASAVRIRAGGNANDDAAGTGARTIIVEGLDANFAQVSETITTAGALVSSATTATFIRVFRIYVDTCGTYGDGTTGANAGDILVETTGGVLVGSISANMGQSQIGVYTVPAGYTAYLTNVFVNVEDTKPATVRMYKRLNADDATAPYSSKRLVLNFPSLTGLANRTFDQMPKFLAKTDLWLTGQKDSAGTCAITVTFDLVLVAD